MASEEVKKKWGTIFMGDREASVEQLSAMQESLRREQRKKEQTEDYMERVRARAADRAREILGAAYAERQKVLEEARKEAQELKRKILADCDKHQAEAKSLKNQAQTELAKAEDDRREAEELRQNAHNEGYQSGMEQAKEELHEFRLELGQSLGQLMRALEWQQNEILKKWRDDLVTLVQCAAQAGAGFILTREHKEIMRSLVFQSLDLLESRRSISLRVNPQDESQVTDLFRAARERYPELGQWIVTGDEKIERGGLVAESGSGSVDLKRENFRELVDGVLSHLALPEGDDKNRYEEIIRDIVEREASRITSLTPELDMPVPEIPEMAEETETPEMAPETVFTDEEENGVEYPVLELAREDETEEIDHSPDNFSSPDPLEEELFDNLQAQPEQLEQVGYQINETVQEARPEDSALAALEEELFPVGEEDIQPNQTEAAKELAPEKPATEELELEPETLAQGGFL